MLFVERDATLKNVHVVVSADGGAGRTSNALRRRPAFFNRRDGGDPLFLGAGCVLGWFGLLHAAKPKPPPPPGPPWAKFR